MMTSRQDVSTIAFSRADIGEKGLVLTEIGKIYYLLL